MKKTLLLIYLKAATSRNPIKKTTRFNGLLALFVMMFGVNGVMGQTYNQVTTIGGLVDGDYLVVGDGTTNDGIMLNTISTTPSINHTSVTNPGSSITSGYNSSNVFQIAVVSGNITIYNASIGYVSWGRTGNTGNSANFFNGPVANSERWTPTVSDGLWTLTNVGTTGRILQWNNSSPRFACYTTTTQVRLKLYKLATTAPILSTPTVNTITDVSATLGATISAAGGSAITARGTSYKTSSPVLATDNQLAEGGTSVAAYSHSRTSLTPQTQYFYAGYATNSTGTSLSSESNFRTLSAAPIVQSSGVSATASSSSQIDLTISTATFPSSGATQAGYLVIFSTSTPTISSSNGQAPAAGVGNIFVTSTSVLPTAPSTSVNVTGLASGTAYNFIVIPYTWDGTNASTYNYLTASAPTASASTNSGAPTLSTPTVSAITHNSATLGATVTSDGGSALIARGTSFKTSSPVLATDNQLAEGGTSVAAFSHPRTSLSPETQYFSAGYATNATNTSLSSEVNFRTLSSPPTVQAGLSATVFSTTQINLTITAATYPGSGATQAGYVVIYSTGTPTFTATNGQAPLAGVGTIFATSASNLPALPSTSINVTGLSQSTLYNFLVIPYTWDGTNASTYNYLTAVAPTANATTLGPVNIAIQDFETSPATPTWNYTGDGAFDNTVSRFNGARSYQLPTSTIMTTDNLDISNYTNVIVSVAYAATGVDSGEDLFIEVSYDNGSTWVGAGSAQLVDGTSNASVNINSLNGLRTPTNTNPYTFNVSSNETQIRLRFSQTGTTTTSEFFWIDDVKVTGVLNTSPTIIRTPISLSGFMQNSATPSSEQTYTVSGNNLTGSVSVVPPTGFEISTTTGANFGTSPIVLTQSGGDLVGEPVTIYVRQNSSTLGLLSGNIVHSSTGATDVNTALSGSRTGTYYSKSTGNLDDLATWGFNTDGTGTSPSNFTSDGILYEIRNRTTATIGANWVVSGSNSKVVVGDGTNATDFTIPSGFTLTGTIDISNAAELTIENTTPPTFGTFATNSTLEYNNVPVTLSASTTYRNLKLTGTGTKTFPGNTTTITGNLTLDGITINGPSSSPFGTILLAGDLTYIGNVIPPIDANSITLSTNGTASGTQTFTGAGNTLRWFRITTTTANTILLSTTGGSSNFYAGNSSGGGITLFNGSVLNMNGNDFELFNCTSIGSAAFIMSTGSISTTSATDFTIERTVSGALGTLFFTPGFNTIGNLTLNHSGATNTLTIGNALNVNGVVTVTDGTLASGGNLTLKSNADGTARVSEVGSGGAITGNVTVERYIPAKRGWRLLTAPLKGSSNNSIYTNWQGTNNEGVLLWHPSGNGTNGLSVGPQANIYTYSNGWSAVTNTNTSNLFEPSANNAFLVFPTGPHGSTTIAGNTIPIETTLKPKGELITGSITKNLTAYQLYLIGNPYASPINTETLVQPNSGNKVWLLDPSLGSFGGYVAYDGANWSALPTGNDKNIQSGQAFFVANSATTTFTIAETHKTSGNSNTWFERTEDTSTDKIRVLLYKQINSAWQLADGVLAVNSASGNHDLDATDVGKMSNFNENLLFKNGTSNLAIEYRGLPAAGTIQPLQLTGTSAQGYELRIQTENYSNSNLTPYLENTQTGALTAIPTDGTALVVPFTGIAATSAAPDSRFRIVYQAPLSADDMNSLVVGVYPNPVKEGLFTIELANTNAPASYTLTNLLGQEVQKGTLMSLTNAIPVKDLSEGVYLLQINQEGKSFTTKLMIK
ncbi:T9SS type A sorting domain-containing protein [Flavobacterium sp.]|jgi:hypothetical protein|uniref:T9SS type A sorting domain-containing protein n=1 Tax=Flavobacterium sp. TaxID=239 RepID=UPI0037BFC749